jgi:carbon-monoxide dehydrogenase medium subunit
MQPFVYHRPHTLDVAIALLADTGMPASALAGGTDLLVQMQEGARKPAAVVDIKHLADLPGDVAFSETAVSVGALVTMARLCADARLAKALPALVAAAAVVGSPQIRNRATLGGNLCNASPAADTVPPLLAYSAEVSIVGPAGRRSLPLADFFTGPGSTVLAQGELLTEVTIPLPGKPYGSAFERMTRRLGVDLASVSVACCLSAAGHAVFGLGAVGPTPIRVAVTSSVLVDPAADDAARVDVLRGVANQARPISDIRSGRAYRVAMLLELLGRAHSRSLNQLAAAHD